MRVALTGVSGFLGAAIARELHEAGHEVTGLVRRTSRREHVEAYVDRFVVGEQADEGAWPSLLDGADWVVHNSVDWSAFEEGGPTDGHLQSNLLGSIRFLRDSRPRPFVFISTIAVHHDMRPRWGGVIDEDHPSRPGNFYGAYKAAVEAYLWAEHFAHERHTTAFRPCGVYGIDPNLERSHGWTLMQKLRRGEPIRKPGGGKFVHVDDVARAVVAAVGNPETSGRVYNLVDCYARWADWAAYAAEILGVEASIDDSSSPRPRNTFTKDAIRSLGVDLDRGHDGIRAHLRELASRLPDASELGGGL